MKQESYVAQRPGCKDCEIASLATVTGHSYEEIAGALGIAINPTTGLPDLAKYPAGIDILDIVYPLFRLGWSAAVIVTQEGFGEAQVSRHGPSSDQLKVALSQENLLPSDMSTAILLSEIIPWHGMEVSPSTAPLATKCRSTISKSTTRLY
jgi:hypothetical protein